MARLKELALNFELGMRLGCVGCTLVRAVFCCLSCSPHTPTHHRLTDRDLIVKTIEKARASEPYRVFLEAHMEIKSVVVRVSGKSKLGKNDLWPMKSILPRLQGHELRNLYIGVKVMVIAFDLLTKTDVEMVCSAPLTYIVLSARGFLASDHLNPPHPPHTLHSWTPMTKSCSTARTSSPSLRKHRSPDAESEPPPPLSLSPPKIF